MNGAGTKLWGYYPTTNVWVPLQVDADGKIIVDMSAINLNDLGDTDVAAPTGDNVLYWDAAASKWKDKNVEKRFYALDDATSIWREWSFPVSSTPRTATVSAVAGDIITLTANEAYRFGEWGASPEYMNAANVYIMIRNTTRGENAWVKASGGPTLLTVTNAADIAAWALNDVISTWSEAATGAANYVSLDISPLVPDGATLVFLKVQCLDSGVATYEKGIKVSKEGVSGTWSNVFVQVATLLNCGYPQTLISAARHMMVRDRATGVDTLKYQISVVGYIK